MRRRTGPLAALLAVVLAAAAQGPALADPGSATVALPPLPYHLGDTDRALWRRIDRLVVADTHLEKAVPLCELGASGPKVHDPRCEVAFVYAVRHHLLPASTGAPVPSISKRDAPCAYARAYLDANLPRLALARLGNKHTVRCRDAARMRRVIRSLVEFHHLPLPGGLPGSLRADSESQAAGWLGALIALHTLSPNGDVTRRLAAALVPYLKTLTRLAKIRGEPCRSFQHADAILRITGKWRPGTHTPPPGCHFAPLPAAPEAGTFAYLVSAEISASKHHLGEAFSDYAKLLSAPGAIPLDPLWGQVFDKMLVKNPFWVRRALHLTRAELDAARVHAAERALGRGNPGTAASLLGNVRRRVRGPTSARQVAERAASLLRVIRAERAMDSAVTSQSPARIRRAANLWLSTGADPSTIPDADEVVRDFATGALVPKVQADLSGKHYLDLCEWLALLEKVAPHLPAAFRLTTRLDREAKTDFTRALKLDGEGDTDTVISLYEKVLATTRPHDPSHVHSSLRLRALGVKKIPDACAP